MRHRPIGFALPRLAADDDVELARVRIPAGTLVFANTAAANSDAAAFHDPDRFDITRKNTVGMLSFGNGAHYCLGSHLARLELTQALTVMVLRRGPTGGHHRDHRRGAHPPGPDNPLPFAITLASAAQLAIRTVSLVSAENLPEAAARILAGVDAPVNVIPRQGTDA